MSNIVICILALIANVNTMVMEPTPVVTPTYSESSTIVQEITAPETIKAVKSQHAELTTVEETPTEKEYIIVHDRPQNENEIYCPEDMTLEEWYEYNPPNDGAYDNWDDENNAPDII